MPIRKALRYSGQIADLGFVRLQPADVPESPHIIGRLALVGTRDDGQKFFACVSERYEESCMTIAEDDPDGQFKQSLRNITEHRLRLVMGTTPREVTA